MDETGELFRLIGRTMPAMLGDLSELELRLTRDCALCLSGEPVADLNMLLLNEHAETPKFFNDSVARALFRNLPLIVVMTPRAAAGLAAQAERLGLQAAGTMQLMVLHGDALDQTDRGDHIERALGVESIRIVSEIGASAFGMPLESAARVMNASLTETSVAEAYLGFRDGIPVSAVTATPTGSAAGIWTMSTLPAHQRKGIGRALLARVIERLRHRGIDRFYLLASPASQPLYTRMGFATIADCPVWSLGPAAQSAPQG